MVPKLTVKGPEGSAARVEWAESVDGPWKLWSNLLVSAAGNVLVDLAPGANQRFYRAVTDPHPPGPPGFVWIEPGTFLMGSPTSEPYRFADEVQHTVTHTRGFWMSDHEVSQSEYQAVMGANPSFSKGPDLPVENLSWDKAVQFCEILTERERVAGRITAKQAYRLPTEAEWEYAARAGAEGAQQGEVYAIAWWSGNSGGHTHPVKGKTPNGRGLYDMMGNVWEWCADWYGVYPTGSVTDPSGHGSGILRVCRGGSWGLDSRDCRYALRYRGQQDARYSYVGFRPVLSSVR